MARKHTGTAETRAKNKYNAKTYARVVLSIPKAEAQAYKDKCALDGITQSDIPKAAISEYLNAPKRTPKSERKQAEESRSNAERAQIQDALAAELTDIAEHLGEIGAKAVDGVQMLFYADVHDYIAERAQEAEARAEEYKQRAKGIIPNNPEE